MLIQTIQKEQLPEHQIERLHVILKFIEHHVQILVIQMLGKLMYEVAIWHQHVAQHKKVRLAVLLQKVGVVHELLQQEMQGRNSKATANRSSRGSRRY